ncbi:hypothetical protein HS962_06940 [Pantoea sp. BIGb0393]|uniref:Uncharacterized protein n=1 Tax=Pantoea nemavictus TaxID=2726955 RepID=A0ABU8PQG1_9GAMM|nr:hypothetical protein [Pantoea nemavictus]MBA0035964.1 hypothetical protein [Pantoea nemavictus]
MYTFRNTERNNKKASEFETKSLLYLLSMRVDSEDIETIAVDCFNDVTGGCSQFEKLWDIQSKNHSKLNPAKIGESLLTLYYNYLSDIDFYELILFTPHMKRDYLIDKSLTTYNVSNFTDKAQKGIRTKLLEKINGNKSGSVPPLFNDFMSVVCFVEDKFECVEYVKRVSKFKNHSSVSAKLYESMFNEIRDKQSVLKNSYIENKTVFKSHEVLNFNRHITKLDIHTLIISRLIGVDVFKNKMIPIPFFQLISGLDEEGINDLILECNSNLSRCFFDKNGCGDFWSVSEFIVNEVRNGRRNLEGIYFTLNSKFRYKKSYLNESTVKYLISLIITGFSDES